MLKEQKRYYLKAFLIAFIAAFLIFLPSIIKYDGMFFYYGDFNAQQVPFNKLCVDEVRQGNFGWNWYTDLGTGLITAYSGILGNPLFWIMAVFPSSVTPYLIGPMLAVKFGLCSLCSYAYINRFVKNSNFALIGGLLYSFSGYSLHNIVFNIFHDVMYVFPLVLIALEEALINKRKGVFCLTIALSAIMNLYFFVGECFFLVIYFAARVWKGKDIKLKAGDIFCLGFESIVGVMLAGILFVPAAISILGVPRATNPLTGISFLFYYHGSIYGMIFETLLFPAEFMPETLVFPIADIGAPSLGFYLPVFSLAGVIAFIKGSKKDRWISVIMLASFIIMLIPGFNSMFSLFNSIYYTRWLYMPILLCCAATSRALEDNECDMKFGYKCTAFATLFMTALILLYPERDNADITYSDGTVVHVDEIRPHFMKTMNWEVFFILIPAVIGIIILYNLLKNRKRMDDKKFVNVTISCILVLSMGLGYINIYKAEKYEGNLNLLTKDIINNPIKFEDEEYHRVITNFLFEGVNVLCEAGSPLCFSSVVASSIFELHDTIGIGRANLSSDWDDCYAWYAITNSKYLISIGMENEEDRKKVEEEYKGFSYYETKGDYDIFINNYVLPVGYTYDNYVPYEENVGRIYKINKYESYYITDRIMVGSVMLNDEQIEKYSHILTETDKSDMEDWDFSFERFKKDSENRRATAIADFKIDDKGNFTAKTNYTEDELVVFSIPYDGGWSCKINGEPAEIEKVNGGFMAVYVKAGENELSFEYQTMGLKEGTLLSGAGVVLIAIWLTVWHFIGKKKKAAIADAAEETKTEE